MPRIVRAISIRQPYVELILRGKKKFEYRSTPTRIRERVYIYASLRADGTDSQWRLAGAERGDLPTGRIVGTVEIIDCSRDGQDGYKYGLKAPKRLRTHLSARNQPQPKFWIPQFGTTSKRQ